VSQAEKITTNFGHFIILNERTVVACANEGENINLAKAKIAINLIEKALPAEFVLIMDRKNHYSIEPVEVYKYFGQVVRLRGIAIVTYRSPDFLPDNMEQRIAQVEMRKFSSVEDALMWSEMLFSL